MRLESEQQLLGLGLKLELRLRVQQVLRGQQMQLMPRVLELRLVQQEPRALRVRVPRGQLELRARLELLEVRER